MNISKRTVFSAKGVITLYTVTNASGATVELSSLGAGITKIIVPDASGTFEDVTLGYLNPADYLYDDACAGKTPGRFANRIANGSFSIDGIRYSLAVNNPPNALHGGVNGFHNRIWSSCETPGGIRFSYLAKDGEEGYPGNMATSVEYSWDDNNALTIEFKAECDKKTIVNLTNHAYFNLSGKDASSCLEQELQLNCSQWLPTGDTDIPLGNIAPVDDSPMDFRTPKRLGKDIFSDFGNLRIGKGYNHFFFIDNWHPDGTLREIATLSDPASGRVLKIATTQCGAMLYTGNWLDDSPTGKCGLPYHDHDGVAIECQGAPDAPNQTNVPSQLLLPGSTYHHLIRYTFTTRATHTPPKTR